MRTDGETDRYDEANIYTSQFCERAFRTMLQLIRNRVLLWDKNRLARSR